MADGDKYSFWNLPSESERIYTLLGVKQFYRIVPTFGFLVSRWVRRSQNWKLYLLKGSIEERSLSRKISATKRIETIHWGGLLIIGLLNVYAGINFRSLVLFTPVQLIINVYPILTQRWVRQRLYRVQKKIEGLEDRVAEGKKLVSTWDSHLNGIEVLDTAVVDDQQLKNLSKMCYATARSPEVQRNVRNLNLYFHSDPVVEHLNAIVTKSKL